MHEEDDDKAPWWWWGAFVLLIGILTIGSLASFIDRIANGG